MFFSGFHCSLSSWLVLFLIATIINLLLQLTLEQQTGCRSAYTPPPSTCLGQPWVVQGSAVLLSCVSSESNQVTYPSLIILTW